MIGLILTITLSQGLLVKTGAMDAGTQLTVSTQKAAIQAVGPSGAATYAAVMGGVSTSAPYYVTVEPGPDKGIRLISWCVVTGGSTTDQAVTVSLIRRTVGSGGTLCTQGATAVSSSGCAVTKYDPKDPEFSGVVRASPSLGTNLGILDVVGWVNPEVPAGATADQPSPPPICRTYGRYGDKAPSVKAGSGFGLELIVSTHGVGASATLGSVSFIFVAE